MSNFKINETHIMVIRKDSRTGKLVTDNLPLVFEDQAKLDELETMSNTPGVTGEDMFNATHQKGLGYLLDWYDFCDCVSGSYQCCPKIGIKDVKEGYLSNSNAFYRFLKSRTVPYCLSKKYTECKQDPSIVAFSSRHIGWNRMNFTLNEDLSIAYNTNFGYGYANYFTANLKYRDIDILPYSMWVNYYNANISQILRYTRTYHISNSEWEAALEFGRDICNSLVQNPSGFANVWLVGEVRKMVDGLRRIFNNHGSVMAVNESNGSSRVLDTKEEIVLYKGEKMSGALSFLGKIKEIEKLNVSMDSYISSILDMNRRMVPELLEVIKEYNEELAKLELLDEQLIAEITPIKNFVDSHVYECAENFVGDTGYSSRCEAEKIMSETSEVFMELNNELHDLEEKESKLSNKIYSMKRVVNTLSGYVDTINSFIEKEYVKAA